MKIKSLFLMVVLSLGLTVSAASAYQTSTVSQPLPVAQEVAAVGGTCSEKGTGLTVGLALSALSPCSIFCAVGAFYAAVGTAMFCEE